MSTEVQITHEVERPRVTLSLFDWLRQNLFNGWLNSIITIVLVAGIGLVFARLADWALTEAVWTPVAQNMRLFAVWLYPSADPQNSPYGADQIWRVQAALGLILTLFAISGGLWGGIVRGVASGLAAAMLLLALVPFSMGTRLYYAAMLVLMAAGYFLGLKQGRWLRWPVLALWLLTPIIIPLLLHGGLLNVLPVVPTHLWGGLLLTLLLASVGITASFPIGVLLALGRRSKLPVVKGFCVAYIEVIRGVPLVTLLFMASIMLPLFLPAQIEVAHVIRGLVAITLFSAAYLAENVRGGLQSVPNGQIEAARSLGLNVFQTTTLILLPQALRAVIPAIVGQFISLFKDTSLVVVVGIHELLGTAEVVIRQPDWVGIPGGVAREVLLFVAVVYWVFSFTMAQVSYKIEQRLGVGVR